MSQLGPLVVDRRPRAKRRCLRCARRFATTADRRCCKRCTAANAELQLVEAATILVQVRGEG